MSTTNPILAVIAVLAVAAYAWLSIDEFDTIRDKVSHVADWLAGRVPSTGRHGIDDGHVSALDVIARVNPARMVQR